eukprot:gene18253-20073_t
MNKLAVREEPTVSMPILLTYLNIKKQTSRNGSLGYNNTSYHSYLAHKLSAAGNESKSWSNAGRFAAPSKLNPKARNATDPRLAHDGKLKAVKKPRRRIEHAAKKHKYVSKTKAKRNKRHKKKHKRLKSRRKMKYKVFRKKYNYPMNSRYHARQSRFEDESYPRYEEDQNKDFYVPFEYRFPTRPIIRYRIFREPFYNTYDHDDNEDDDEADDERRDFIPQPRKAENEFIGHQGQKRSAYAPIVSAVQSMDQSETALFNSILGNHHDASDVAQDVNNEISSYAASPSNFEFYNNPTYSQDMYFEKDNVADGPREFTSTRTTTRKPTDDQVDPSEIVDNEEKLLSLVEKVIAKQKKQKHQAASHPPTSKRKPQTTMTIGDANEVFGGGLTSGQKNKMRHAENKIGGNLKNKHKLAAKFKVGPFGRRIIIETAGNGYNEDDALLDSLKKIKPNKMVSSLIQSSFSNGNKKHLRDYKDVTGIRKNNFVDSSTGTGSKLESQNKVGAGSDGDELHWFKGDSVAGATRSNGDEVNWFKGNSLGASEMSTLHETGDKKEIDGKDGKEATGKDEQNEREAAAAGPSPETKVSSQNGANNDQQTQIAENAPVASNSTEEEDNLDWFGKPMPLKEPDEIESSEPPQHDSRPPGWRIKDYYLDDKNASNWEQIRSAWTNKNGTQFVFNNKIGYNPNYDPKKDDNQPRIQFLNGITMPTLPTMAAPTDIPAPPFGLRYPWQWHNRKPLGGRYPGARLHFHGRVSRPALVTTRIPLVVTKRPHDGEGADGKVDSAKGGEKKPGDAKIAQGVKGEDWKGNQTVSGNGSKVNGRKEDEIKNDDKKKEESKNEHDNKKEDEKIESSKESKESQHNNAENNNVLGESMKASNETEKTVNATDIKEESDETIKKENNAENVTATAFTQPPSELPILNEPTTKSVENYLPAVRPPIEASTQQGNSTNQRLGPAQQAVYTNESTSNQAATQEVSQQLTSAEEQKSFGVGNKNQEIAKEISASSLPNTESVGQNHQGIEALQAQAVSPAPTVSSLPMVSSAPIVSSLPMVSSAPIVSSLPIVSSAPATQATNAESMINQFGGMNEANSAQKSSLVQAYTSDANANQRAKVMDTPLSLLAESVNEIRRIASETRGTAQQLDAPKSNLSTSDFTGFSNMKEKIDEYLKAHQGTELTLGAGNKSRGALETSSSQEGGIVPSNVGVAPTTVTLISSTSLGTQQTSTQKPLLSTQVKPFATWRIGTVSYAIRPTTNTPRSGAIQEQVNREPVYLDSYSYQTKPSPMHSTNGTVDASGSNGLQVTQDQQNLVVKELTPLQYRVPPTTQSLNQTMKGVPAVSYANVVATKSPSTVGILRPATTIRTALLGSPTESQQRTTQQHAPPYSYQGLAAQSQPVHETVHNDTASWEVSPGVDTTPSSASISKGDTTSDAYLKEHGDRLNMDDLYWTDSSEEKEEICKQDKGTNEVSHIMCFGDSLTRGYYNKGKNHHPYTNKLQFLLNKLDTKKCYIVDNEGKDGELAFREMPRRLESLFNGDKKNYKWTVILGGTNDIYNKKAKQRKSAEEITRNIVEMHEIAWAHHSRTVAVTIPEVFCETEETCEDAKQEREKVNYDLRAYANQHKDRVILVDLADMLQRSNVGKDMVGQFFEGGLHLRPRGYERMAIYVYEGLRKALS